MRNERYRMLLPEDRLANLACTIIGVGAIGRQVAVQLGAMGVGKLQLVDFDRVEEVNLGSQGYLESDVGQYKVDATADLVRRMNAPVEIEPLIGRYARHLDVAPVVFCCVDSIATRRHIWTSLRDRVDCFIDGRMAAEVLRVLTVTDPDTGVGYLSTLFHEQDALREACTARSTFYCASVAAGIMVSQMTQWLRGMPVTFDLSLNLLALELEIKEVSQTELDLHSTAS